MENFSPDVLIGFLNAVGIEEAAEERFMDGDADMLGGSAKSIGDLAAELLERLDRKRGRKAAEPFGDPAKVVQAVAESGREPLDIQKTGYVPAARSGTRDNGRAVARKENALAPGNEREG